MPESSISIEQVEQALVAFEDALTPQQPSNVAVLSAARVNLAKCVNSFIAGETVDITILDRLGVSTVSQRERQMLYKDLIALRIRYSEHIAGWTPSRVAEDWRRYRSDSVSLVVAMRKILRVRQSQRTLVPA